jgi:hypothetical protein
MELPMSSPGVPPGFGPPPFTGPEGGGWRPRCSMATFGRPRRRDTRADVMKLVGGWF